MKKIVTLAFLAIISVSSFAQSQKFVFTTLQTNLWGDANNQMTGRAYVKNITSDTLHIKVKRMPISVVAGSQNFFCWDVCYTPITSQSVHAVTMLPDSVMTNFYADFLPNGNPGLSSIRYCFFDENNVADSTCIIAYFNASATGVESHILTEGNHISNAFPNPSNGVSQLVYSVDKNAVSSKLELHNMLGSLVKVMELKERSGTAKLSLNDLEAGIYFYSLVVDGKTISTKKLVVQ